MLLRRSWCLFILFFGMCLPLVHAETQKESDELIPVVFDIDPSLLQNLSPEKIHAIESLKSAITTELSYRTSYQFELPPSAFSEDSASIIDVASLLIKPNSREVEELAFDKNGEHRALNSDQVEQIRKKGLFMVPSKDYPGQFHVWEISTWLQKGADHIRISYEKDKASALGHIIIQIPERFSQNGFISARKGVSSIYHGLRGMLSNVIGLVEMTPKYSKSQIDGLVEEKKLSYVKEHLKSLEDSKTLDFPLDTRLYDDALSKKVNPVLAKIRAEFQKWWSSHEAELRARIKKGLSQAGLNRVQLDLLVEAQLHELSKQKYNGLLLESAELETLAPGYATLLINRNRAIEISEKLERNLTEIVHHQEEVVSAQIRREHPTKANIPEWLAKEVKQETERFYRDIRWDHLSLIPILLEEEGLKQEAFIFSKILEFQKEHEEAIRDGLSEQEIAAREFEFERRIWNSKNWIKEEYKDNDGHVSYYPKKYASSSVSTQMPLWRVANLAQETRAYFSNGLYNMLVTNLWNGPVGLKSLVMNKPFTGESKMDSQTGNIVPDESSLTHTLRSRLRGIWRNVEESRHQFESSPDTGFLGKKYTRWINKFWNYGIKGPLSSVAVTIGQPFVTTVNTAVTGVAVVTSPVWAPLTGLFKMGFSIAIYDTSFPGNDSQGHSVFPLVSYCVKDIVGEGVCQAGAAVALAGAFHPVAAVATGLYSEARKWTRSGYDWTMRQVLLNKGRVPASDSFIAWRIAGPGLSSNYFYQVRPEIAVMAIQAFLESKELNLLVTQSHEEIQKPLNDYENFFKTTLGAFGKIDVSRNSTTLVLSETETNLLKEVDKKVLSRSQLLAMLTNVHFERSRIKQNAEDLAKTLQYAEILVKSFFEEHLATHLSAEALQALWQEAGAMPGDYKELTHYLITEMFSEDFLVPLEKNDETFVIHVGDEHLASRLDKIIGSPADDKVREEL